MSPSSLSQGRFDRYFAENRVTVHKLWPFEVLSSKVKFYAAKVNSNDTFLCINLDLMLNLNLTCNFDLMRKLKVMRKV